MFIDNGRGFAEARLLDRLTAMFGDLDVGNGTPLASAVASAICIDMRTARADPGKVEALDRDTLVEVATELDWALHAGDGAPLSLPFGTEATSTTPGSLRIGDATFVLDASRPGLHAVETTRQDAHGPNLERLRSLIERRTKRLACRRLGLPAASSLASNEMRHNLQFPPCADAGGVVLQRRASETGADRFCAATAEQLNAFADSIVRDMRELWTHRKAIGARVDEVRRACEEHILEEHGPDAPVSITALAVELCGGTGDQPVSIYVAMDSIGEALRPGTVLEYIPGHGNLEPGWLRFCDNHAHRTREAAELAALGATGRISALAAAVAASAPEGQAAVLDRLGREVDTQLVIPTSTGDLYATLYWQNGYIEADLSLPGRLEAYRSTLELRATLPATVLAAMPGRPLADLASLPIRPQATVQDVVVRPGGWLRISLTYDHALVNCETGMIWPESA